MTTSTNSVRRFHTADFDPGIGAERRAPRPTWESDSPQSPLGYSATVAGHWDALEMLSVAPFFDGTEPFAVEARLEGVTSIAAIAPNGPTASPSHRPSKLVYSNDHSERWLLRGDGWTFSAVRRGDGDVDLTISAVSLELRDAMLGAAKSHVAPVVPDETTIPMSFWFYEQRARIANRRVAAPTWSDIERNYPVAIRPRIDRVMATHRPEGQGRLLLWHGPPGTGKTTATRALARAWAPWCRTTVIAEPERLFNSAGLIFDLVSPDDDDVDTTDDQPRWNLLVVEDADELVRADARSQSGQALSRLLNLADGFIGQGLDVLILLSTNERLSGLHPAVSRPGRCLSEIEFPRIRRDEAAEWLGRMPATNDVDYSLAELIKERDHPDDQRVAPTRTSTGLGLYL